MENEEVLGSKHLRIATVAMDCPSIDLDHLLFCVPFFQCIVPSIVPCPETSALPCLCTDNCVCRILQLITCCVLLTLSSSGGSHFAVVLDLAVLFERPIVAANLGQY